MTEIIQNEFGQRVRVMDWEDLQVRLKQRKAYTGKEDLNGKILVIKHTWGLGDILYSTPALRALKEKFPKVKIVYICGYPEILENNPDVDEVHHWMQFDDFLEIGDKLKGEEWYWLNFDVPLKGGFDYKIHLRTKPVLNEYLVSLLRKNPKELRGQEREFVQQASNTVINRYRLVALDMYCWHAHVDPPEKSIYYFPTEAEMAWAKNFLAPLRKRHFRPVVLIPHTSTLYKDYPHWREVIRKCPWNYFWIILDSKLDPGENWAGTNLYNCSGAFKLRHAIALSIEADLLCCSDTGMLYPRAAQNKPCVVTYGPHEPQPFLHYFPSAHGLRIERLQTTPGMEGMCSVGCYIDTESCHGKGEYTPCLRELSSDVVSNKARELLEGNS